MQPKLCKDCKHFDVRAYECRHPFNIGINIVMGGTTTLRNPASLRDSTDKCGRDGKWWEAKEQKEAA